MGLCKKSKNNETAEYLEKCTEITNYNLFAAGAGAPAG